MAKTEVRTCDICGIDGKIITMTLYDNELEMTVNTTDLCENHFNRLRSYLRHDLPIVSKLPLEEPPQPPPIDLIKEGKKVGEINI